jgi:plasma-membrane calcium-translocating P-type ATPase
MNYHLLDSGEIARKLGVDPGKGLSGGEAERRRKHFGSNELAEGERQSAVLLFFRQFKDFMVLVLLAATLISGMLGEYIDAAAILFIVLLNGILGFFQEYRAERSLAALKKLSAPTSLVLREGQWQRIPSTELVPGDIIRFSAGDRVGADCRLFEAVDLEIEESALTGESLPAGKRTEPLGKEQVVLGDMNNMAFMGTMVTRGSGRGIVIATGMETAMGRIAGMLQEAGSQDTPLALRLAQLGKILIIAAFFLTFLVVVIGVLQGNDVYTMFLSGVSLAVAAIPEGLPAIVTISLSLGVQRMIKKNALVRKLPAVETLGCASVICSDKTGTMTENKMMVTHLYTFGKTLTVDGQGYVPEGRFYVENRPVNPAQIGPVRLLIQYGLLCSHAELVKEKRKYMIQGDPTEGAIVVCARKAGFQRKHLLERFKPVREFPFDSERKRMTIIVKTEKGEWVSITKGAPEILLDRIRRVHSETGAFELSASGRQEIQRTIDAMAARALRTIAVAYRKLPSPPSRWTVEEIEKDLTFLGLFGIIDPPRPEVARAVDKCRKAGIKTVMITGDHAATAKAIGEQLGLVREGDLLLEGAALNRMDVGELEEVIEKVSVFARVSPEHKLKIVKAFQNRGHVVAMTGDGVNDAPAIKSADIGIAMGITGTDVAKEASDLILMDDNFATVQAAVQEGRNIYENIRKFIRYLLASNVGEILVMLLAMIVGLPLPLVPVQILWVNLVTDGLPAMALAMDGPEDDVMGRGPRKMREGVFARGLGWKIISRGFLIGISTLTAFIIVYSQFPDRLDYARTVAFITLVLAQLIHVFDCRSEKSILARNPFGNPYLVLAVLSSVLLLLAVIYLPVLHPIFDTVPILPRDWLLILAMASLPTFLLAGTFYIRKK